jgi:hypothetical protein
MVDPYASRTVQLDDADIDGLYLLVIRVMLNTHTWLYPVRY